ncbi:hypothetical protein ACFWDI_16110 [Streptomyces sp. NPDC060064]|uniref:hypothetical protein n=1 Tax=Streptomyces sp. NPDC060064 TaxID=3347049 RepID=UPI00369B1586
MGIRDRVRDAVLNNTTRADGSTPALAQRATQAASVLADTAADHSTAAAYAIAGLGAAAVAAEGAMSNYVYPKGEYATFSDDGKKRGRR